MFEKILNAPLMGDHKLLSCCSFPAEMQIEYMVRIYNPVEHLRRSLFAKIANDLKDVNYLCKKAPS